ncbi:MAG: DUF1836 domain-containing protein [Eubacterium sp.]
MTTEQLQAIIDRLDLNNHITIEEIPNLDLYMDQLITLFENRLGQTKRTSEDKLLTKTMINNYTKNKLLIPAHKKKYTKDHILLMLLIYQLKQVTSMDDIKVLFSSLMKDDAINHDKLHDTYQNYLNCQNELLESFKENVNQIDYTIKEKSAGSKTNTTDPLLMILLLFEQSLHYKRLAEKLLDETFK